MKTDSSNLLDDIIGHLAVARLQRSPNDDRIIGGHIDDALRAAKELRRTFRHDFGLTQAQLDAMPEDDRRAWWRSLYAAWTDQPAKDAQAEHQADHYDHVYANREWTR